MVLTLPALFIVASLLLAGVVVDRFERSLNHNALPFLPLKQMHPVLSLLFQLGY
ncbi:MAG TPA: hypothetical protein V6C98_06355 [Thermosynechococcaceae cyanobacterium]